MKRPRLQSHPYIQLKPLGEKRVFSYNGKPVVGYAGDTIASALYAWGVRTFSRSFKYHRPRGFADGFGQGADVLLTVDGEPNVQADATLLEAGMQVSTQNAWPSVDFDLLGINQWVVPKLPSGFYYKMFHKPKWAWPLFEKGIRKAAGLGKINTGGTPPRYEKCYRFPDVCVIGGGVAGMAAALGAAAEDKQVLLLEQQSVLGGSATHSFERMGKCRLPHLESLPSSDVVRKLIERVNRSENIEVLTHTAVFGLYEDNLVVAQTQSALLKIRAEQVVVATGATDRHGVFENNDLPGVMTATGVERLIALHRVVPGEKAVLITHSDRGYHTALMLHGAGCAVTVIDARSQAEPREFERRYRELGLTTVKDRQLLKVVGGAGLEQIELADLSGLPTGETLLCDVLVTATGYKPNISLLASGREKPYWDDQRGIFRLSRLPAGISATGKIEGTARLETLFEEAWLCGRRAAQGEVQIPSERESFENFPAPDPAPLSAKKQFLCKCMDVTVDEAEAAIQEGFNQVETLKRYTSAGMGRCQGKTCYESVARFVAKATGKDVRLATPTTMRPPAQPVSFGVLAGRAPHLVPTKRTPMHDAHVQLGAKFLDAGLWKRPESYGDVLFESHHVRTQLGIVDVSTLGKIELSGPDVLDFLHFMLPGKFAKLALGRTRYCVMVGEDGVLFEDGTLSQLDEGKYYLTTTTGNQDAIVSRFYWWLTTEGFDVRVRNLGSVLAAVNIAGKASREFLQSITDADMSPESFPYMHCRRGNIAQVPVSLFRIGFTGELGYEIHYPSEYGESLWNFLLEEGRSFGLRPFGIEAQRTLRLEKGHLIPGVDTDALTNPYEAGVGFAIKPKKPDFVGKKFLENFASRKIRERLVGFRLDGSDSIPEDGVAAFDGDRLVGRVTSSRRSSTLGYGVGLVWLEESLAKGGKQFEIRLGNGERAQATVLSEPAYDPKGEAIKS